MNLIGEHTDYNDGFVLPVALDGGVSVRARPRADALVRLRSAAYEGEEAVITPCADPVRLEPSWARYPAAVLVALRAAGLKGAGFDAEIESDLPIGGGLSSSAALDVAFALAAIAVARASNATVPEEAASPARLAALCRDAEARAAGVRCGIMDPFVALHAREGTALLLDCRSLEHRCVPIDPARVTFVVAESGVRHALAAGEYNRRRAECEDAVRHLREGGLDVRSLRDVRPEDLEARAADLPPVPLRRARHVVSENRRTVEATRVLEAGDFAALGRLLDASHESLRDDYEVSCAELDVLVEIARAVPGVFGSRMTGGGFGGSTVTAVRPDAVPRLVDAFAMEYPKRANRKATVRVVRPSGAATVETD